MNEVQSNIMTEGHRDYDKVVTALRAAATSYRDTLDPTGSNRLEVRFVYDDMELCDYVVGAAVGFQTASGNFVAYVVFPMPSAEPPIV